MTRALRHAFFTTAPNIGPLFLEGQDDSDEVRLVSLDGVIAKSSRALIGSWLDDLHRRRVCGSRFEWRSGDRLLGFACELFEGHNGPHSASVGSAP
jgi:hypothetical protein